MSERLTVEDLRARLGGVPDPTPILHPKDHADLTEAVGGKADLVSSTLAGYRANPPKAGFRRGGDAAQAAAPSEAPRGPAVKSNKYAGQCVLCHQRVEAGEGRLARGEDGWQISHNPPCPAPAASTDTVEQAVAAVVPATSTATVSQSTIKSVTGQVYTGIHPGRYTIETPDGHRTFRVRVQGTDDDFAPGQTILEWLTGPNNKKDYTGLGFLRGTRLAVWEKQRDKTSVIADAQTFLADPDGEDVIKQVTCIRCGDDLTVPESVKRGMGPTCLSKGW